MICRPGDAADVRAHCGSSVQVTEIEIDDSWTRDSGPVFVVNDRGDVAAVDFGFNSWGGKYVPYDHDAALGQALADVLGVRRLPGSVRARGRRVLHRRAGHAGHHRGTGARSRTAILHASRELFEQVAPSTWGPTRSCGWSPTRTGTPTVTSTGSPS